MSKELYQHIEKYTDVSAIELEELQQYIELRTYKKKETLLAYGDRCRHNYFVIQGCLQMYYPDDGGRNRTLQFALENWWITDNLAFMKQQATEFTIQAVETSTVLSISFVEQEKLLQKFPQLEKYFRQIYQIGYGAAMKRFKYMFGYSKEERYLHFITQYPEFTQRVPQYLIASFLDLTPEYVSEIRAKNLS